MVKLKIKEHSSVTYFENGKQRSDNGKTIFCNAENLNCK